MELNSPKISVLITVYNREKYLHDCIESLLSQTLQDFEVIIVDDNSSDSSFDIAKSYALIDSRFRVFKNPSNIGQFPNRNKAASLARSEYLKYLDSDDTLKNDALEYIYTNFQKTPSHFSIIYQKKDILFPTLINSKDCLNHHFFKGSILHIGPSGTVISKSLFNKIGGFPTNYGPIADMYYNIGASIFSDVLLLPYNYLNYRIHDGQELNNKFSYLYNGYVYFNNILSHSEIPLSKNQIYFLLVKNKRRFVLNSIRYFFDTFNLKQTLLAYKYANFKCKDILIAIFQR